MGSISSPILNSITRGREPEFEERLVCAFAGCPHAKIDTTIRETMLSTKKIVREPLGVRCEGKKIGEEFPKKGRACGVSGTASVWAETQRRHISPDCIKALAATQKVPGEMSTL
jgi:hypothetical protein